MHYLECYRRVRPQADAAPLLARWQAGGIDAVTVTSAETLHNLAALLGEAARRCCWRPPRFSPRMRKSPQRPAVLASHRVIATPGGDAGLVAGLINWFRNNP